LPELTAGGTLGAARRSSTPDLDPESASIPSEVTTMRLADIMTPRVVTIKASEPASAAWTRMRRRGIRHLVVTDMGEVAGVVSERDLGGRSGAAQRRGRTVGNMMTRSLVTASPEVTVR
jgi:CBS domain-containing protein